MLDAILVQISTSYIYHNIRSKEAQLGQYYIAEYARHNGLNIKIKKYDSHEPVISSLQSLIDTYECKRIGFYVDSENLWTIRRILFNLKKANSGLFVFIGGPQVTGDAKLALKRIPNVDCAIIGEGERPVTEILKQLKCNQLNFDSIKGIAYLDANNKYRFTGSQIAPKDLDCYPFPRRKEYSIDENMVFDQISTGRGCIGRCAFCYEGSKKENVLRLRSVENVIEEIDYVISNLENKKYISFLDDTFIINPKRAETICNHLIEKYDGKIGWFCEARVDILIKNLHLLPLMKRAGLIRIQLGGESGNQRILDAYQKNMQIEQLKKVVSEIHKTGIASVYINFIVGGAFETLSTFNDTVELAKTLLELAPGCAEVGCSLLSPYVGTPIRNTPSDFGIKLLDTDLLRGPDGFVPFVETEELTEYKILQLKSIFEREIEQKAREILITLSNEEILANYHVEQHHSMASIWYNYSQEIESYKNYFEAISKYGFLPLDDMRREELNISVPFRTIQPTSDGERYYRVNAQQQLVENNALENAVFMLSSGKICYYEIVQILKRSDKFKDESNLEQDIYDIFQKFDKERLIVWKRDF